jgi:hypothetical protein
MLIVTLGSFPQERVSANAGFQRVRRIVVAVVPCPDVR